MLIYRNPIQQAETNFPVSTYVKVVTAQVVLIPA